MNLWNLDDLNKRITEFRSKSVISESVKVLWN